MSKIASISGQLERVASEIMIESGEIKRIDVKDFPPNVPLVDDAGRAVSFAVLFPNKQAEAKFDALVADLRA